MWEYVKYFRNNEYKSSLLKRYLDSFPLDYYKKIKEPQKNKGIIMKTIHKIYDEPKDDVNNNYAQFIANLENPNDFFIWCKEQIIKPCTIDRTYKLNSIYIKTNKHEISLINYNQNNHFTVNSMKYLCEKNGFILLNAHIINKNRFDKFYLFEIIYNDEELTNGYLESNIYDVIYEEMITDTYSIYYYV
jgi:hypothetical protein